tara:strand:+ start:253 stop:516 length:264 start_codon:yes stop_codon:yes gene_type:complete
LKKNPKIKEMMKKTIHRKDVPSTRKLSSTPKKGGLDQVIFQKTMGGRSRRKTQRTRAIKCRIEILHIWHKGLREETFCKALNKTYPV